MFKIFQLIIFFVFLLSICSIIPPSLKKTKRIIISILIAFLIVAQVNALYITGNFINYQFYIHMQLDSLLKFGTLFIPQIISFCLLLIALTVGIFFLLQRLSQLSFNRKKVVFPIIVISFYLLCLPAGIFRQFYVIYQMANAEKISFKQALNNMGVSADEYVTPEKIKATKGKNIIVISIESLEKGFLTEAFKGLTPSLSRLAKDWNFYNIEPTTGCGWTAGSLYCHQTGLPAFYNGHNELSLSDEHNEILQHIPQIQLVGLGHVLNKADYNTKFLIGDADFAGTKDLLKAYEIPVVWRANTIAKYPSAPWGLYDKDLFNEAKLQLAQMTQDKDKPFALFLSTVDTHFPDGIYDTRMEKYIGKKDNNMEFCVATVDYLIDDFIKHLKSKNLLENTAVYIFPDHLLMGGGEIVDKLRQDKRQLYLISNVNEKRLHTGDKKSQLDLPRLIIDGAEIKTNAKFFVDYLQVKNINKYISDHQLGFASLNASGLQ